MKLTIGIINLITSMIYFATFLFSQSLMHGFLSLIYLTMAGFFVYIYLDEFNRKI